MKKSGLALYWENKRGRAFEAISSGQCVIEIRVTATSHSVRGSIGRIKVNTEQCRIYVTCPPNPRFSQGARELLGRWRPKSGCWSFDIKTKRYVIELCKLTFGENNVTVKGEKYP